MKYENTCSPLPCPATSTVSEQCHAMWWAATRACSCQLHTPCSLVCASFYGAPQSSLGASAPYARHRNRLAITDDTAVAPVSQNSTAEGEPPANSLCQGESNLSDPARIILSFTSASFFRNQSHLEKGLLLEMVFLFRTFTSCSGQTCFCFPMFSVSCGSPETSDLLMGG